MLRRLQAEMSLFGACRCAPCAARTARAAAAVGDMVVALVWNPPRGCASLVLGRARLPGRVAPARIRSGARVHRAGGAKMLARPACGNGRALALDTPIRPAQHPAALQLEGPEGRSRRNRGVSTAAARGADRTECPSALPFTFARLQVHNALHRPSRSARSADWSARIGTRRLCAIEAATRCASRLLLPQCAATHLAEEDSQRHDFRAQLHARAHDRRARECSAA